MTPTLYALNMGVQACPSLSIAILMLKTHMSTLKQRFIRPAQAPAYGISRATAYNWIRDGLLKTTLVRRPGNKLGCRLIDVDSLEKLIAKGK
jgi:Helix-turn-helix domain